MPCLSAMSPSSHSLSATVELACAEATRTAESAAPTACRERGWRPDAENASDTTDQPSSQHRMSAARCEEARQALCASSSRRTTVPLGAFPLVRECLWSGAGTNRRPSAFQVNHAKRYADLQKRTSPTSETALGGRCKIHASRTQCTPSTRQDSDPARATCTGWRPRDQSEPTAHAVGRVLPTEFTLAAIGGSR